MSSGSQFQANSAESQDPPVLIQFSTLDAVVAGAYDGFVTMGELKRKGNFGIGTFDRIDGEGIMLDGVVYQVKSDGRIVRPSDSTSTPFASIVRFQPSLEASFDSPLDYKGLRHTLDKLVPTTNSILAIRVRGRFSGVRTRSSYAQTPPYPTLTEAMKNQPEFDLDDGRGDLIGYRLPSYVNRLNMSGYHFHFLNEAKDQGGHALQFVVEKGMIEIQKIDRFEFVLPPKNTPFYQTDLTLDREQDARLVEGAR